MLNLMKIGEKIIALRKERNYTQTELAEKLFVSRQAVSKWEQGKSLPSIEILYELTKLFTISIDYLLDDSELEEHDYEGKLKQLPRSLVVNQFITSSEPNKHLSKIFYLLNTEERNTILSLLISKSISIEMNTIWPYLNDKERKYMLSILISNKEQRILREIFHLLKQEERFLVTFHYQELRPNFTRRRK